MSGYPPPSAPYAPAAPPAPRARPAGPVVTLVGLAVTVLGLFALPLNDYGGRGVNSGVGFVQVRGVAADFADSPRSGEIYGGLATFWWRFGAFLVLALVVMALALLTAGAHGPTRVVAGVATAVVAVVGGVIHAVAMATSADYETLIRRFARDGSSFYDRPGSGVWVSLVGFAVLTAGGVVAAVTARTRSAALPPPPPSPAGPPR